MKRILCILDSLNAGGAETFLMKVSRTVPVDEYQLDFVVSHKDGVYVREIEERGGRIYLIPTRHSNIWGAFWGIRNIVKENRYESVLKLGNTPIAVVDLIAAKLGGATLLAMRSCNALTGLSCKDRIINSIFRPLLNCMTNVKLAPSLLAAEFTFGEKSAHTDVHLLNNGVDLDVFHFSNAGRKRVREELSMSEKLVVGHIGRFHKQKNHRYLLKVFNEVLSRQHNAVLLLVGVGDLELDIRNLAREMNIEHNVIFAGTRMDIPDLLSAMDVFILPSFYEGMPNTVIEAQATGLPCIISDTITKEANITGLVQYLSLEQSPEVWADMALASSRTERRDTTLDFLKHHYDIQSVAKQFVGLICP